MAWRSNLYTGTVGGYTGEDDRTLAGGLVGAGLGSALMISATNTGTAFDYRDLVASAGSGMYSQISAGRAAIDNSYAGGWPLGGSWIVRNDATVQATTAHASNSSGAPRIDLLYVQVLDSETGGSGSNGVQTGIVTGTATAGATLSNLSGAPALSDIPSNSFSVAYVLVPNGAGSAASFSYRDLRRVRWNEDFSHFVASGNPIQPGCSNWMNISGAYTLPPAVPGNIVRVVAYAATGNVTYSCYSGDTIYRPDAASVGAATGGVVVPGRGVTLQGRDMSSGSGATWLCIDDYDSGWVAITSFGTNCSAGSHAPAYRQIGNRVFFHGQVVVAAGGISNGSTILTTPGSVNVSQPPFSSITVPIAHGSGPFAVNVTPTTITSVQTISSVTLDLGAISYVVNN